MSQRTQIKRPGRNTGSSRVAQLGVNASPARDILKFGRPARKSCETSGTFAWTMERPGPARRGRIKLLDEYLAPSQ